MVDPAIDLLENTNNAYDAENRSNNVVGGHENRRIVTMQGKEEDGVSGQELRSLYTRG